jgi:hypothetical protein
MEIFPRISGRIGRPIDLNITFYQNGIPTDPYAIIKVQIYRSSVQPENLIAEIPVLPPWDPAYPAPVSRELVDDVTGACGTAPDPSGFKPGVFHLFWDVPKTLQTPDIYFDVWTFIPTNPGIDISAGGGTVGATDSDELALLQDESLWQQCCNEFWLYPDSFYCDSGLQNIRLGFEAIDINLYQPERRTIEVGIMPLPLYDFPYNKIAPIIPQLKAFITISTENCEIIVSRKPMRVGLRQGTYRTNPFVLQYLVDTSQLYKGSYRYRVELELPNGETRASSDFILQVS